MIKGLKESVKLQWSGDVDLNDGCLHKQYDEYKKCLERAEKAGLVRESACTELKDLLKDVAKDLEFIQLGT